MVEVSPGNIRQFGKLLDDLAEDWNNEYFPLVQFTKVKDEKPDEYPDYGATFEAATTIQSAYDSAYSTMVPLVSNGYELMKGLADAAEAIATKYDTSAERANAKVADIQKILEEHVTPPKTDPGAGDPTDPSNDDGK